jgi:hypothetical protein
MGALHGVAIGDGDGGTVQDGCLFVQEESVPGPVDPVSATGTVSTSGGTSSKVGTTE